MELVRDEITLPLLVTAVGTKRVPWIRIESGLSGSLATQGKLVLTGAQDEQVGEQIPKVLGMKRPGRHSSSVNGVTEEAHKPSSQYSGEPQGRSMDERRPTRSDLAAAYGRAVPDLIASDLKVLFCGINPSLYSAATGHHFARPGNRFWPALYGSGFTQRLLKPWEEEFLLEDGIGITNLVSRATATAAELTNDELRSGRQRLARKVRRFRPRCVAVVGIGAYRVAFNRPGAIVGLQARQLAGAAVWVLPNPSGLNANHQLPDLAEAFRAARIFVNESARLHH
jgi:double-stranded uracil-DNA glycosylase